MQDPEKQNVSLQAINFILEQDNLLAALAQDIFSFVAATWQLEGGLIYEKFSRIAEKNLAEILAEVSPSKKTQKNILQRILKLFSDKEENNALIESFLSFDSKTLNNKNKGFLERFRSYFKTQISPSSLMRLSTQEFSEFLKAAGISGAAYKGSQQYITKNRIEHIKTVLDPEARIGFFGIYSDPDYYISYSEKRQFLTGYFMGFALLSMGLVSVSRSRFVVGALFMMLGLFLISWNARVFNLNFLNNFFQKDTLYLSGNDKKIENNIVIIQIIQMLLRELNRLVDDNTTASKTNIKNSPFYKRLNKQKVSDPDPILISTEQEDFTIIDTSKNDDAVVRTIKEKIKTRKNSNKTVYETLLGVDPEKTLKWTIETQGESKTVFYITLSEKYKIFELRSLENKSFDKMYYIYWNKEDIIALMKAGKNKNLYDIFRRVARYCRIVFSEGEQGFVFFKDPKTEENCFKLKTLADQGGHKRLIFWPHAVAPKDPSHEKDKDKTLYMPRQFSKK